MIGNGKTPVYLTPLGGVAHYVINDTGAVSQKGRVVENSKSVDGAVSLTANGDIDPCGIIYDDGIPNGGLMRIVFSGIAEVYYGTAVTRGTFARVAVLADGVNPGEAVAEALPTSPFATDKHFQEIGHPRETIAAPGLALTTVHFN